MTTMLVWFLVTISYNGDVQYSPPMLNVQDCKRLQSVVAPNQRRLHTNAVCVQLEVVK